MYKSLILLFLLLGTTFAYGGQVEKEIYLKVFNSYQVDLSHDTDEEIEDHPLGELIQNLKVNSIKHAFQTADLNLDHTFILKLDQALSSTYDFSSWLERYSFIEYIEFVPQYELFFTPNDPLYNQQWALNQINAENAWDISQGSSNIVIAIVDDAVRTDHQDLQNVIFSNPNETLNGIDDDNNGFVDDIQGWDAADNDNDANPPLAVVSSSNFTHGTHVAGLAGASTNNNLGIASIGFGCSIMPVKIKLSNSAGPGLQAATAGVDYAIASGYVDVVNMSFGGGGYSLSFQNLINAGHNAGIVFVAAAGNSNTNAPMYPAAYNHVIAVGASTSSDTKASFSNYGNHVDVMAPGTNMLSSVATGTSNYLSFQGTSMASPVVAGLCGLMLSYSPNSSPQEIESCLTSTSVNIDPLNPAYTGQLGAGRINAETALACLSVAPIADFAAAPLSVCPNQPIQFSDSSAGASPLTYQWQFPGGIPASSTQQNPVVTYPSLGNYDVSLTVTNAFGNDVYSQIAYIQVQNTTAAVLSGNTTIVNGGTAYLEINYTGAFPYSFTYSDGTSNFTVNNLNYTPYFIPISPSTNTTYSLVDVNSPFCGGTVSGTAEIEVLQISSPGPVCTDLFQLYLDDNGDCDNLNIIQANNGDYLVSGYSNSSDGQGGNDVFLARYDSDFNWIWSQNYGTPITGSNTGNERSLTVPILEMDDGSIIMGCESNTYGTRPNSGNITVLRLGPTGTIIWQKRLNSNVDYSHVRDMIKENNEVILVGSLGGSVTPGGLDDTYIVKLDINGNIIYSDVLMQNSNDHMDGVVKHNQKILAVGNSYSFGGSRNPMLYSYDLNGNLNASYNFNLSNSSNFEAITNSIDNNLWVIGNDINIGNGDFYLLKMDDLGNTSLAKRISSNGADLASNVYALANGNIIVTGQSSGFGNGGSDIFVSLFDSNLNEIWTKVYGGSANESIYRNVKNLLINEADNYGVVVANTTSYGGADVDALVVKFSLSTDTLCNETVSNFWTITNQAFPKSSVNFTQGIFPGFINATFSTTAKTFNPTTICTVECNLSSGSSCRPSFHTVLNDNGNSEVNSIFYTQDGGFILAGYTQDGLHGSADIFVSKFDFQNNLEWNRIIGTTGDEKGSNLKLVQNTDGSYFLTFDSYSFGSGNGGNTVIAKLSPSGLLIWQKSKDLPNNSRYLHVRDLLRTGNTYLLTGSETITTPSAGFSNAFLMEIDANGNTLWSTTFNGNDIDHSMNVLKHSNGNIYWGGPNRSFGTGPSTQATFCADATGNFLWSKSYDILNQANAMEDYIELDNGDILGLGRSDAGSNSEILLLRISPTGDLVSAHTLAGSGNDRGYELELISSNSVLIVGTTESFGNGSQLFATLIDLNANENWTKLFGGTSDELAYRNCSMLDVNLSDSVAIIAGSTLSYGGVDNDPFIIQFSLTGADLCDALQNVWTKDTALINEQIINAPQSSIGSFSNASLLEGSKAWQSIDSLCTVLCDEPIEDTCENNFTQVLICLGDSLTLDAGSGYDFQWSPNYNISDLSIANPVVYPRKDTIYTLVYQSDSLCQRLDTFVVNVDSIAVQAFPDDTLVCASQTVPLLVTGAISYEWLPNTGLSNNTIANPTFSGTSSQSFIVEGTSANGCASSDSIYIEVLNCCGAQVQIEVNDSFVCIGNSIQLINNSIYSTNPQFTWDFGPNASPSSFNGINPPAVIFNQTGIQTVTVILSDDCGNDTANINIAVLDLPVIEVINDTTLCASDSLVQLEIGGIMNPDYQYNWSPTLNLDDPDYANPIASVNSTIEYTLSVNDIFGCINNDSLTITFVEDSFDIQVAPIACGDSTWLYILETGYDSIIWNSSIIQDSLLFLSPTDSMIIAEVFSFPCSFLDTLILNTSIVLNGELTQLNLCLGDTAELTASNGTNYAWTPLDSLANTNQQQNQAWPEENITYYVDYILNNCGLQDTFILDVNEFPLISTDSLIEAENGDLLELNVTGGSNWTWTPSTGLSCSNCQNPSFTADGDIVYVVASENEGCITYDTVFIQVNQNDFCLILPDAFSPNQDGVNDLFYPVILNNQLEVEKFSIYNRWGEMIHDSPSPWDGTYQNKRQHLGVYVYIVEYMCNDQHVVSSGNFTLIR